MVAVAGCDPQSSDKEAGPAKSASAAAPAKSKDEPAKAAAAKAKPTTPEAAPKAAPSAAPEAAPEAPPADAGVLKIAKFGLEAKIAGAKAEDSAGDSIIVRGPELTLRLAKATDKTYATAKKAKRMSAMMSPKNWKAKDVDGGYVATFEYSDTFWVRGYRTIGGTAYDCSTTVDTEAEANNAAALCESLTASS